MFQLSSFYCTVFRVQGLGFRVGVRLATYKEGHLLSRTTSSAGFKLAWMWRILVEDSAGLCCDPRFKVGLEFSNQYRDLYTLTVTLKHGTPTQHWPVNLAPGVSSTRNP